MGFTGFFRVFITFHWVWMGFSGFYRVLPSFTGFLEGFTGFDRVFWGFHWVWVRFTGFFLGCYRVSPGFTELDLVGCGLTAVSIQWKRISPAPIDHRRLECERTPTTGFNDYSLDFIGFYRVFLEIHLVLLGFFGFYWVILGYTGFYWVLLGFTGFYWVSKGFHWGNVSFMARHVTDPIGSFWSMRKPPVKSKSVAIFDKKSFQQIYFEFKHTKKNIGLEKLRNCFHFFFIL